MTLHEIVIEIQWGHTQRETRMTDADTVVRDLINDCVRDHGIPRKDREGTMVIYGLYRGEGNLKQLLDPRRTLRELRVHRDDRLYLSAENSHWWLGPAALPEPPSARPSPPKVSPDAPLAAAGRPPCIVELAAGCTCPVPENGLMINRAVLLAHLPRALVALERARTLIGLPSRLAYVSRNPLGHCVLSWLQGWQIAALQPVYIAGVRYEGGEPVVVEQTTTVLLGRAGWPITIRPGASPRPHTRI